MRLGGQGRGRGERPGIVPVIREDGPPTPSPGSWVPVRRIPTTVSHVAAVLLAEGSERYSRGMWIRMILLFAAASLLFSAPASGSQKLTMERAQVITGEIAYKAAVRHGAWAVRQGWARRCRRLSRRRIRCEALWKFFTRHGSHYRKCWRLVDMKLRGNWIRVWTYPKTCRTIPPH